MVYVASTFKLGSALLQIAPISQTQTIVAYSLAVGTLPVAAIVKFIPLKHFIWTMKINLEEDRDDNKLLYYKTLFSEKMNTLTADMQSSYANKMMNESQISVNHNDDRDDEDQDDEMGFNDGEDGQMNGQADGEDEDGEDRFQDYSINQGYRSSINQRYSMKITDYKKKK